MEGPLIFTPLGNCRYGDCHNGKISIMAFCIAIILKKPLWYHFDKFFHFLHYEDKIPETEPTKGSPNTLILSFEHLTQYKSDEI